MFLFTSLHQPIDNYCLQLDIQLHRHLVFGKKLKAHLHRPFQLKSRRSAMWFQNQGNYLTWLEIAPLREIAEIENFLSGEIAHWKPG